MRIGWLFLPLLFLIFAEPNNTSASPQTKFSSFFPREVKPLGNQNAPFEGNNLNQLADVLPATLMTIDLYGIDEPNFEDLCLKGTTALLNRDSRFRIQEANDKWVLLNKNEVIDTFSKLQSKRDLKYWAVTALTLLNRASEHSTILTSLKADKFVSIFLKNLIKSYDSLGKYVPPHKANPSHYGPLDQKTEYPEDEVTSMSQIYNETLYLKIKHFGPWTAHEIITLLKNTKSEYKGIIFDLRDNLGGRLDQAIEITECFLEKGLLASSKGRHLESFQQFEMKPNKDFLKTPLILIVNHKTASAAEVLAAGLKENGRALVLGEKTYGKGTIQRVQTLPNGGIISFTWAKLFTPMGNGLDKEGITPLFLSSVPKSTEKLWSEAVGPKPIGNQKKMNSRHRPFKDDLDLSLFILSTPKIYEKGLTLQTQPLAF